ncbi:hypothetical protein ACI65C_003908 [Semiaphis heraclei]
MSVDEGDARVQRLKRSCEIKRMNYVKKIRAIHKLAIQSAEDTSVVPQLLVMVETLDQLLSSFTIEDEALLGHLLDLGLENEYPDTEGVEIFELVCSAKATANRFMQYCPDKTIESTHGGSQVSLNNAGRGVPTSDEQSIPDNVVVDVSPGGVQSNNAGSLGSNKCIPREPTSKQPSFHKTSKTTSYNAKKPLLHTSMVTSSNPSKATQSCKCCNGTHGLTSCPKFKGWTQEMRNTWARDQRICFRCLRTGHWVTKCKSSNVCGQCSRWHHTLLHSVGPAATSREESSSKEGQSDNATTSSCLGQNTVTGQFGEINFGESFSANGYTGEPLYRRMDISANEYIGE